MKNTDRGQRFEVKLSLWGQGFGNREELLNNPLSLCLLLKDLLIKEASSSSDFLHRNLILYSHLEPNLLY
jgi:hypothetical protein